MIVNCGLLPSQTNKECYPVITDNYTNPGSLALWAPVAGGGQVEVGSDYEDDD